MNLEVIYSANPIYKPNILRIVGNKLFTSSTNFVAVGRLETIPFKVFLAPFAIFAFYYLGDFGLLLL